jgi:hypothetical protein
MPKPGTNSVAYNEALRLESLGFAVVPCKGKRPIIADWPTRRLSPDDLRANLEGKHLNIAIAINQSNLIDVECDSPEAEAEVQSWFEGNIPLTPTWRSKRGKHRLFQRPPGLPSRAALKLGSVELRIGNGKGALSIVPPSVHPDGGAYRWEERLSIHDVESARLPPHIVDRLRAGSSASKEGADIPEGKRNTELFRLACQLAGTGLAGDDLEIALQAINSKRCKPPLPQSEVASIAKSAGAHGAQGSQTSGEILLEIATRDSDLWHTTENVAYATIVRDGHREHWRDRSTAYRQWLGKCFYDRTGRAAGSQTVQDVINVLEGKAIFDGPEYPAHVRVAKLDDRIYVDLCDANWRVIEIDEDGWRVLDESPVRFRRAKGMLPLPEPQSGGSADLLRRFVNVTDADWPLLIAWLLAAMNPEGPYPILKLFGEQGSAKTTTARVCRAVIDPNSASVRSAPRTEEDLMIAAINSWTICLDNLSFVSSDLSDGLCRLSTGGGLSKRTKYTDDEETLLNAKRPVVMTAIEEIGIRSDLLDRSLIIDLPRIEPDKRRTEREFWRDFEEAHPLILGAILDAVSVALRKLPAVARRSKTWPRMADFAQWAVAGESALGLKPGDFLKAYDGNRESANQTALESSPVVAALLKMMLKGEKFEGTATDLLNRLQTFQQGRKEGWPKVARVLSGMLKRLSPNLRAAGFIIEETTIGSGNDKRNGWSIERKGE